MFDSVTVFWDVYLKYFIITVSFEILIAYFLGFKSNRDALIILLINLITHPLMHFILLINNDFRLVVVNIFTLLLLFLVIVLIEGILLTYFARKKFFQMCKVALAINTVSFIICFFIVL